MITVFGVRLCPFDLITDGDRLSATKIWMHVANVIMSMVMLRQPQVDWELLAAYGSVVGGSHIATIWLKRKYPAERQS